jgi:hypothetical protein
MQAETRQQLNKYFPRPYQQEVQDAILSGKKKKVFLCWARGAGKDIACWNTIIRAAILKPGNYFYALPTAVLARQVVFDTVLGETGKTFLDFIPSPFIESVNISRMLITFKNGSRLQCVGSEETSSRLVGTNPTGVVWSEWQVSREDSYTYLRPRLALNDGWCIFNGTPRGMSNHFFSMYKFSENDPDWLCSYKTVYDTKHIRGDILLKEKASMSIDKFNQEYLCDFNCGQAGTYYGLQMDRCRLENRISDNIMYEAAYPVWVSIDIGVRDPTAVIYYQVVGNIIRILECEEFTDQGVDYLKKMMDAKDYAYAKPVWAPHDAKVREWGAAGALSRIESARNLGLELSPVDNLPLTEGIEAVRMLLGRCWFHQTKAKKLIASLENYRRIYDEERKAYQEKPLHDWTSHLEAAFRYLTIAMPQCHAGTTQEELDQMFREAKQGHQSNLPPVFRSNTSRYY